MKEIIELMQQQNRILEKVLDNHMPAIREMVSNRHQKGINDTNPPKEKYKVGSDLDTQLAEAKRIRKEKGLAENEPVYLGKVGNV